MRRIVAQITAPRPKMAIAMWVTGHVSDAMKPAASRPISAKAAMNRSRTDVGILNSGRTGSPFKYNTRKTGVIFYHGCISLSCG